MKSYYVYILKCRDNSYYTGVTNNIERRIEEHQSGEDKNAYTYHRRPLKLVFCEDFTEISQAIAFEKQIKGWTRNKKEAIIENNWVKLKELAACKNQSHHSNLKST